MKSCTEFDYRRRIARVITEIVADPAADHSVESLAEVAHFSPFHFHRIYRATTGEGIAATVRRLRLALASHRLAGTSSSVILTALEAGYDSPQSFARAFREFTGLAPTEFQSQQAVVGTLPPVTLITAPAMVIYGLWHEGPVATIPHSFRRLRNWTNERGYLWSDLARVGVSYGDPEQSTGFKYFAGITMSDGELAPDGLEQCKLSGGCNAAYRLVGPYALISPTFQTLFGGWLPQSGLEPDDRPVLEIYRNHPGTVTDQNLVTDLLIPIIEASS
ncbi:GyrI-like domain-containing protein [Rhizobium sp. 2YAF20]|uniref:AraC family transcriptional regulator n=1 Tax=Rhizobium sp. 2YAF20 TaxID=3233027 RepID=UPI003F9C94EE